MRPIIGIVSSSKFSNDIIYSDNVKVIEKALGEPIGLVTNIDDYVSDVILKECDGFLFQGGSELENFQLNILNYAYSNNIPVIGICLGFELIATRFFGFGSVVKIEDYLPNTKINHHLIDSQSAHSITTTNDSWLQSVIGNNALVNSRHIKTVTKVELPFIVSAYSEDSLIEAVEYIDDNHFIIGLQFHPENIESMQIIFDKFVKVCKEFKEKRLINY